MSKFGQARDRPGAFRRLKRPLIVAVLVVGFFVLSNYYMGFFNPHSKPIVPAPLIPKAANPDVVEPITAANDDDKQDLKWRRDSDKPNADDRLPDKGNKKGNKNDNQATAKEFDPPAVPDDPIPESVDCKHTRDRDYEEDPIVISGRFSGMEPCDVPCRGDGTADAVVGYRQNQCPHIKSIFFTMENSIPPPKAYDIVANTQLNSDVPLPYFSWAEYEFRRPVARKTATAHVAAFISNCGPQKRLQWMDEMMKHGVKIDSYGNCNRNKEVPAEYNAKYGSNYNALKTALVSTYKFTMAFENSHTDDYVTEKLFGVFVAGSIPLYDGAANGKKFGPSPKSMIFAEDYHTPARLAEYILYLDSNDTAYEEYLQWKKYGPSDDWVALVDLSNVHSNCRLCIRAGDLNRKEVGPVKKGQPKGEPKPTTGKYLEVHVRARGKFWLHTLYLTSYSLEDLKAKILKEMPPPEETSYIYSIYELWSRTPVDSDEAIATLAQKAELEVIYVTPENWESLKLMW